MLEGQRVYGREISRADDGPISLGRNFYPILPEDRFDRRPLERGDYKLVADVRLDNRSDLGLRLGLSSGRLDGTADSELLFECLLSWGESACDRLVGEFAFALWNRAEQSLLLGRDLFGARPLYYHRGKNFVAFASMPSGLHALPEVPRDFDSEFIAESLALLPHTESNSYFHKVARVQPAHFVRITQNGVAAKSYWDPPRAEQTGRTPRHYEEGLRDVLEVAVQSQLRGAGDTVASHLSSGLDSSIITSTAARLIAPRKLIAFTAVPRSGFDGPIPRGGIGNEAKLAGQTAAMYPNIEQVLVESSAESPFVALDREHFFQQQPIANLCNAVWGRAINRIAHSRGAKVLFVGNSGNMTVTYSGMDWLPWLISHGRLLTALRAARSLASNGVPWRSLRAQMIGGFLPVPLWALACKLHDRPTELHAYSAVKPELRRSLKAKARERNYDLLYRPSLDPLNARLWVLRHGDGGNFFKGVLAEWGLSVRDPMSDKRVVEFCLSVPAEEYVRGGVPRSLARRTFADRLPAEVAGSLMRGYQSPDWYEAVERDFPRLVDEAAAISRCSGAADALDMAWVENAVRTWPTGDWADHRVLFRYRHGLLRAISAGHFMRKVAGTN